MIGRAKETNRRTLMMSINEEAHRIATTTLQMSARCTELEVFAVGGLRRVQRGSKPEYLEGHLEDLFCYAFPWFVVDLDRQIYRIVRLCSSWVLHAGIREPECLR